MLGERREIEAGIGVGRTWNKSEMVGLGREMSGRCGDRRKARSESNWDDKAFLEKEEKEM